MSDIKELIASKLRPVANKIREKTGLSETFSVDNMPEELDKIITSEEANEMIKKLIQGGSFETLYIPEGIIKIKPHAFREDTSLKKVVLPDSVKSIETYAFKGCASLTEINLKEGMIIRESALEFVGIADLYVPDNCVLGKNCFYSVGRNSISFPKTILNIDNGAAAKNIYYRGTISDFLKTTPTKSGHMWADSTEFEAFYFLNNNGDFEKCDNFIITEGVVLTNYRFSNMTLPKVTFASDTTIEGYKTPFNNAHIDEIIIPENTVLKGLTVYAFSGLYAKILKFPNAITYFSQSSISCWAAEFIELGNNVSSIGKKAITISSGSAVLKINTVTPPALSSDALSHISKIYVPKGCAATYKSATNWSAHASIIFEPNTIGISISEDLLNNENYKYSIDGNELQQFTENSLTFENIATFKIKNSGAVTINIGTTEGGNEIGSVGANAELLYSIISDTTIYLTVV